MLPAAPGPLLRGRRLQPARLRDRTRCEPAGRQRPAAGRRRAARGRWAAASPPAAFTDAGNVYPPRLRHRPGRPALHGRASACATAARSARCASTGASSSTAARESRSTCTSRSAMRSSAAVLVAAPAVARRCRRRRGATVVERVLAVVDGRPRAALRGARCSSALRGLPREAGARGADRRAADVPRGGRACPRRAVTAEEEERAFASLRASARRRPAAPKRDLRRLARRQADDPQVRRLPLPAPGARRRGGRARAWDERAPRRAGARRSRRRPRAARAARVARSSTSGSRPG